MWWQPLILSYFLLWRSPRLCSRPSTLRHVHHTSQYSDLFSFPRPPPLRRWYSALLLFPPTQLRLKHSGSTESALIWRTCFIAVRDEQTSKRSHRPLVTRPHVACWYRPDALAAPSDTHSSTFTHTPTHRLRWAGLLLNWETNRQASNQRWRMTRYCSYRSRIETPPTSAPF